MNTLERFEHKSKIKKSKENINDKSSDLILQTYQINSIFKSDFNNTESK